MTGVLKLAALAAAPVFYQTPLYRLVAADPRVDLTVFYGSRGGLQPYDAGFGGALVTWDEDLLGGHRSMFLQDADSAVVADGFLGVRARDVAEQLSRGRFDVLWVHGYSYLSHWRAIRWAVSSGVPLLIREEQTLLHSRPFPKSAVRAVVLRRLFSRSRGLYIGSNNKAFFQHYGVPEERLHFTPYCVDNASMQSQAVELHARKAELRREMGLKETPVVLFVGKLGDKKKPELLLRAFSAVRAVVPCQLVFAGDGDQRRKLQVMAADLGLIEDVTFLGFLNRSQIGRAYGVADVFVLPSAYHETWGLVVNEAMNFGLPVVVSDKVGCAADLVEDGGNGRVFPACDALALQQVLTEVVGSPEVREAYGRRSRQIIDGWTYDIAATGIVEGALAAVRGVQRR